MVSFAVQKLLSLIRSHLFVFVLLLLTWVTDLEMYTIFVREYFAYVHFWEFYDVTSYI